MRPIPYLICFALLLPNLCSAQSNGYRLGHYIIGITTPDSLQGTDFKEDEQSYVKGTIALPCTHIRTFSALKTVISGVAVSNLSLAFYDNKLFKISCDYTDQLQDAFIASYGKGMPKPAGRFSFCSNDKPMLIWGDVWQTNDGIVYVVHSKGYNYDCEQQKTSKLVIASQRFSALASDCELKSTDLFTEEFEKMLKNP